VTTRTVFGLLRRPEWWTGILLTVPVFLAVGPGLRLAPSAQGAGLAQLVLPFSAFALPPYFLYRWMRRGTASVPLIAEDILVLAYSALTALSLLVGMIWGTAVHQTSGSMLAVARLSQTLFPLPAYFLPRLVVGRSSQSRSGDGMLMAMAPMLVALMFTVSVALAGYVIETAAGHGGDFRYTLLADHIGPFYNFRMKRFFPAYLAIDALVAFAFYLFSSATRILRTLALGVTAFAAAGLTVTWSRSALLMGATGLAVLLGVAAAGRQKTTWHRLAVVAVLGLTVFPTVALVASPGQLRSVGRLVETVSLLSNGVESVEPGDINRIERMTTGVEVGLGQPLGDMFQLHKVGAKPDVLETESGYLDIAIRGGPLALLLLLAVFLRGADSVARRTLSFVRERLAEPGSWATPAMAGILAVLLFGNTWLNLATEPYFSPFLWFSVGVGVASRDRSRQQPGAPFALHEGA
jgi:hypothetical protein